MNGKGDKPRNCFSKQYKDNYEQIKWSQKNSENRHSSGVSTPSMRKQTDAGHDNTQDNHQRQDIIRGAVRQEE